MSSEARTRQVPEMHHLLIIGSGFSGLCAAIQLKQNGFEDFLILEKENSLGGTWRDNIYPGAACDIPSYLYSFSFEMKPDWSRKRAKQKEILSYMEDTSAKYGIDSHYRFNHLVEEAIFHSASSTWAVNCANGNRFIANFLLLGIGGLHHPSIPNFPGRESFDGPQFHSSRWPKDFSIEGKRVGVIGSAASAIQLVPAIAERAKEVHIFQRHANYIVPSLDYVYPKWFHVLAAWIPLFALAYRWWLWFFFGEFLTAPVMKKVWPFTWVLTIMALGHLAQQVQNQNLRAKLTPGYPIGAKRILISDSYYPTLTLPHVHLVTTSIEALESKGIRTSDGILHECDIIIFATGFKAMSSKNLPRIIGRMPTSLAEHWGQTPVAYLGITVAGFPNLFSLLGPNTGLGHNSVLVMIEAQVQYLVDLLKKAKLLNISSIEVKAEVQEKYNLELQRDLEKTVWACDVDSWYKNSNGVNFTCWPHSSWAYMRRTGNVDLNDYKLK